MRLGIWLLIGLWTTGANAQEGERIFNRVCVACHMTDARGIANTAPELHEHVGCLAARKGGRVYLAGVLKYGLEGPISVEGTQFDEYMPAATQLSSEEKAAVLTYVISLSTRCPKPAEPISVAEIDEAFKGGQWNPQTIHSLREGLLQAPAEPQSVSAPAPQANSGSTACLEEAGEDFTRFCQGCHAPHGGGVPAKVPVLRGNVGLFLQSSEGRAFLVRVPGVAFAPLDDRRLANLLNWVVQSLSAEELPAAFVPFSAAEVSAGRREPLVDVAMAREQIRAQLLQRGFHAPQ